jgi:3-oxoacyl-[acyl-carrier protein] reductase
MSLNRVLRNCAMTWSPSARLRGLQAQRMCPGPLATPLANKVHTEEVRAAWHQRVPMQRYGTPEEVAATIRFFIDDASSGYGTGQVLSVDGGFTVAGLQRDAFALA